MNVDGIGCACWGCGARKGGADVVCGEARMAWKEQVVESILVPILSEMRDGLSGETQFEGRVLVCSRVLAILLQIGHWYLRFSELERTSSIMDVWDMRSLDTNIFQASCSTKTKAANHSTCPVKPCLQPSKKIPSQVRHLDYVFTPGLAGPALINIYLCGRLRVQILRYFFLFSNVSKI